MKLSFKYLEKSDMNTANFCLADSKCSLCGKVLSTKKNNKDIIVESISGSEYLFDKAQCLVIFKRLNNFYGNDFKTMVEFQ